MRTTTFIYVLKDPRTETVRYVGKSNNPKRRYGKHINNINETNTHKKNWINSLLKENLKPKLEIIDEVSINMWKEVEKMYIKKYKEDGCDLLNYTEGGDGCTFANRTSYKKGDGAKKIVMLDKQGNYIKTFDMVTDVAKELNVNNGTISHILNKRRKSCKNNIFLYEDEYSKMTNDDIKNYVIWATNHKKFTNKGSFKNNYIPKHKIRIIYQYSIDGIFIQEWISASDAGRKLDINIGSIGNCARKKSKSAGGFFWTYKK